MDARQNSIMKVLGTESQLAQDMRRHSWLFADLESAFWPLPSRSAGGELVCPGGNGFKPAAVESNLTAAIELLDRCIALRSEEVELLASAMNAELDLTHLEEAARLRWDQEEAYLEARLSTGGILDRRLKTMEQGRRSATTAATRAQAAVDALPKTQESRAEWGWTLRLKDLNSVEIQRLFGEIHMSRSGLVSRVETAKTSATDWADRVDAVGDQRADLVRKRNELAARRAEGRRHHAALRSAATQEGGPLNYVQRAKTLHELWIRDFGEAIRRVCAVRDGLRSNHGEDHPIELDAGETLLSTLLIWARDRWAEMELREQREVEFKVSLSLKELLGDDGFEAGLKADEFGWRLSRKWFPRHCAVRIRGVSVWTVHSRDTALGWPFSVRPPLSTSYIDPDGSGGTVTRNSAQPAQHARVSSRPWPAGSALSAAAGETHLTDLSPLSGPATDGEDAMWSLSVVRPGGGVLAKFEPKDVIVELAVVAQSVS